MTRVPAGQPPQRRQRQRDAEEPERPDAGLVGEIAERVRAEISGEPGPHQPRTDQGPTKRGLSEDAAACRGTLQISIFLRSMPAYRLAT